jgi:hypothetical protein
MAHAVQMRPKVFVYIDKNWYDECSQESERLQLELRIAARICGQEGSR